MVQFKLVCTIESVVRVELWRGKLGPDLLGSPPTLKPPNKPDNYPLPELYTDEDYS